MLRPFVVKVTAGVHEKVKEGVNPVAVAEAMAVEKPKQLTGVALAVIVGLDGLLKVVNVLFEQPVPSETIME